MKLSNYGYKERTTKFYPMEMGQMKNLVLQAMVRNNAEDDLVRIVCVTDGEVLEYNGMRELILADFNNLYEVNVLRMARVHMNDTNKDVIVVNIEEIEDDEMF